jgi:hypothetical protein
MSELVMYENALKQKAKILKSLKPLRRKENRAVKRLQRKEKKLKAIRIRIVTIEEKRGLAGLSKTIARLALKQRKLNG